MTLIKPTYFLAIVLAFTSNAQARIGLVVGEPFGSFGTMMPSGHAGIYLDHICADTPTHLRPCNSGELGVVVARYHDLRHPNIDWMATPASIFFYGVENPSDAPQYMTASLETELREAYRQSHLLEVAPDHVDRHGIAHPARYGDWDEAIGAAFDRRLFLYTIETTPEQDANIINTLNESPDKRRYSLRRANCADFANDLLGMVLPRPIRRNVLVDFDLSSPKNLARQLETYGRTHPELNLQVYEIPQIPGTLRRSRPLRSAVDTFLFTKRYLATLLIIQPEFVLADWVVYEKKGKWTPGFDAAVLTPGDHFGSTSSTMITAAKIRDASGSFVFSGTNVGTQAFSHTPWNAATGHPEAAYGAGLYAQPFTPYLPASTSSSTASDASGFLAK